MKREGSEERGAQSCKSSLCVSAKKQSSQKAHRAEPMVLELASQNGLQGDCMGLRSSPTTNLHWHQCKCRELGTTTCRLRICEQNKGSGTNWSREGKEENSERGKFGKQEILPRGKKFVKTMQSGKADPVRAQRGKNITPGKVK